MRRLIPFLILGHLITPLGPPTLGQGAGARLYLNLCESCHPATGQALPGAFFPLTHLGPLFQTKGGREYLIRALLYGLKGQRQVGNKAYDLIMPPYPKLKDQEVADLLNYVAQLAKSKAKPITPEEVKAQRARPMSPEEVLRSRPTTP